MKIQPPLCLIFVLLFCVNNLGFIYTKPDDLSHFLIRVWGMLGNAGCDMALYWKTGICLFKAVLPFSSSITVISRDHRYSSGLRSQTCLQRESESWREEKEQRTVLDWTGLFLPLLQVFLLQLLETYTSILNASEATYYIVIYTRCII